MFKRCIMIFPEFQNGQIIDNLREKYDPLAHHVRPHITLVFPFVSDIGTEELKEHILSATYNCQPFEIELCKITPEASLRKNLFLNVQEGSENIKDIHEKLYTGILRPYNPKWLKAGSFLPHMTIGSFENEEEFEISVRETKDINDNFKTIVNRISVEIIDENEDSIIELDIPLTDSFL